MLDINPCNISQSISNHQSGGHATYVTYPCAQCAGVPNQTSICCSQPQVQRGPRCGSPKWAARSRWFEAWAMRTFQNLWCEIILLPNGGMNRLCIVNLYQMWRQSTFCELPIWSRLLWPVELPEQLDSFHPSYSPFFYILDWWFSNKMLCCQE